MRPNAAVRGADTSAIVNVVVKELQAPPVQSTWPSAISAPKAVT